MPYDREGRVDFRCPKCRALCVMVNTQIVECVNPYCEVWTNAVH